MPSTPPPHDGNNQNNATTAKKTTTTTIASSPKRTTSPNPNPNPSGTANLPRPSTFNPSNYPFSFSSVSGNPGGPSDVPNTNYPIPSSTPSQHSQPSQQPSHQTPQLTPHLTPHQARLLTTFYHHLSHNLSSSVPFTHLARFLSFPLSMLRILRCAVPLLELREANVRESAVKEICQQAVAEVLGYPFEGPIVEEKVEREFREGWEAMRGGGMFAEF
ncbi:hypothetical protein SMACR_06201 [Sordaria macrospora]|uniref:WGS project CABT00000000 data, contig 2.3 n=2 Tax=Sordaria macrospora TaxID=5147 RepID=F7VP55_SORMK|nr:uncharacterized protein SMAC_06201 [Sordaria macrospora k-hell]KAA8632021.1 hypothetical protein SMACR_06201 [Sordaria macrospora]WPJ64673.1 hypothetical protein SMAC4_06201 [Sordaria macrospora]CCC07282.1 unnamed protein product [Sordaria macrospora k-hell]